MAMPRWPIVQPDSPACPKNPNLGETCGLKNTPSISDEFDLLLHTAWNQSDTLMVSFLKVYVDSYLLGLVLSVLRFEVGYCG